MLSACSRTQDATIVYFDEQEGSNEPYRTRMIVTSAYIRFDDNDDKGDFVLYDRKQRVIYSTNSMDKRTLVIRWTDTKVAMPEKISNRDEKLNESVPSVGGHVVRHYRLHTNDSLCYDLYAADGLLPDAVSAMTEFAQTLGVEHAAFLKAAPQLGGSPCDAMNNVYRPARYLKFGFPVHARDYLGRSRQLVDYQAGQKVSAELFELPKEFHQFTTEEIRGEVLTEQ
ncbi:MAG: hypothetical protein AMJ68_00825 [Acidithiobacillales bacterium SG8_45]|nr:MAG: hypothetical protein AMJ68_00825 [Acidithiobacillales bacterium SG8_45]